MAGKHSGSCLCGAVRYEITGEFDAFFLCHCRYCQKDSGSAHAANLFSGTAQLKWLEGEEQVTLFDLPGTRHSKAFCQTCGSALPHTQMAGKLVVVPAGSLDSPVSIRPDAHIMLRSKADWDERLDEIEKLDGQPT